MSKRGYWLDRVFRENAKHLKQLRRAVGDNLKNAAENMGAADER